MNFEYSLPNLYELMFGIGPVGLFLWFLVGLGGNAFLVLLLLGPRKRYSFSCICGALRLQFGALILICTWGIIKGFSSLCGGSVQFFVNWFFIWFVVFVVGCGYLILALTAVRFRFGKWPELKMLSLGSILCSMMVYPTLVVGMLPFIIPFGATGSLADTLFAKIQSTPTSSFYENVFAGGAINFLTFAGLFLGAVILLVLLVIGPRRRNAVSYAYLIIRLQLIALLLNCLGGLSMKYFTGSFQDYASNWFSSLCRFALGCVYLLLALLLVRLRFRKWPELNMLSAAAVFALVLAPLLLTTILLLLVFPKL